MAVGKKRRGSKHLPVSGRGRCDVYELACLKLYAEPLLFGIGKDEPEYIEAKRLLKFFDYFVAVPSDDIPRNSLLREFVGGSCFDV